LRRATESETERYASVIEIPMLKDLFHA